MREGYRGLNKGVNAVALRQMTTWGSRMGITRFIETTIKRISGREGRLNAGEKIIASCGGGALSCWNQPLEVSVCLSMLIGYTHRDANGYPLRSASTRSSPNHARNGQVHLPERWLSRFLPWNNASGHACGECDDVYGCGRGLVPGHCEDLV